MRRFRERQAVRDDVVELDLALLDPPDQFVDVALRRALAETHFDAFVENLAERKVIVGHTIDARDGDPAAASHRANRGAQRFDGADFSVQHVFRFVEQAPVTLEPNGINADVCAAAICHVADRLHELGLLLLRGIEGLGICGAPRGLEAIWLNVDADDAARAFEPGDFLRHEPDRTAAKHRDNFAALGLRPVDAGIARGQDVSKKEQPFVGEITLHLARAVVRIRHADELRLTAIVAAVEIRVAEKRAALFIEQPALGAILFRV